MANVLRHILTSRACALFALAAVALAAPSAASAGDYLIVYKREAIPAGAKGRIADAEGRLVHAYAEIGVAVARSGDGAFRAELLDEDPRVAGVLRADAYSFDAPGASDAFEMQEGDLPNAPASDADALSPEQWNLRQIDAPEAHSITGGSPAVTVADLDSGVDFRHPDLAENIDFLRSANCASGAPVLDSTGAAWDDAIGHGTFTAGLIAAAANGVGMVGTAPNVKLAAIKISTDAGTVLWPAVVCGLVHAGRTHMDVANNSYAVDPSRFFCRNVKAQQLVVIAVQRAVQFARREGVTVVASSGNENIDLAHPPTGNECVRVPTELPGVVTVSAVGDARQKAFYSNYGVAEIDLAAPGGDPVQPTGVTPFGTIVSTWPAAGAGMTRVRPVALPGGGFAYYRYDFGTSFAAPHVAGVAALVVSRFGDLQNPENGKMRPGRVEAILEQTADRIPCPDDPFAPVVGRPVIPTPTAFPATCEGGDGYNGFYGHGQVNALRAVMLDRGSAVADSPRP